jgi:hypothetical protein
VNYLSFYLEVSKPFQSFVGKFSIKYGAKKVHHRSLSPLLPIHIFTENCVACSTRFHVDFCLPIHADYGFHFLKIQPHQKIKLKKEMQD